MTQSWTFTPIQFKVLCERYRSGHLPTPLFFTLDDPMTTVEYARLKDRTWEELCATWDPAWDSVIDVMCAPELFIRLWSWDELDLKNGQKNSYMHFARKGVWAYKFEQKPGKTYWHSDGFVVTECDPRGLAEAVVGSLPDVPAGRISDIPVITEPQDRTGHGRASLIKDDDHLEDSAVTRSERFFQRRASLTGSITTVQGRSKYGPRGIHETQMLWRDVIGDGRYVMTLDDAPVAVATGPNRFVERIQADIDNLMARLDTHWEDGHPGDRF